MNTAGTPIDPQHAAILAVDFQPDTMAADGAFGPIFHAELERTHLIPRAIRLLDSVRATGVKIVYSRAAFQPGYTDLVSNIPLFSTIADSGSFIEGAAGTTILDAVAPHEGDLILAHARISCFHGTALDVVLRGAGISTVVLTGVATNLAVESTARAAADLGYRVVVVSDASSTTTQKAHDASLASLAFFAEILTADEVLAALELAQETLPG